MTEPYLQFQQLQQEIQQLYDSLEQIAGQRNQVAIAITAITDIEKVENVDIMAPLINGIFFNAKIDKVTEFRVNVGNGVVVKKTPEETKTLMQEQIVEMDKITKDLTMKLGEKLESIQKIEGKLQNV